MGLQSATSMPDGCRLKQGAVDETPFMCYNIGVQLEIGKRSKKRSNYHNKQGEASCPLLTLERPCH